MGRDVKAPDVTVFRSIAQNVFNPAAVFTGEKGRGLSTSLVTGAMAASLQFFGMNVLGMSLEMSTVIFMNLFGTINGYIFDILFAKRDFRLPDGSIQPVPYRQLKTRAAWLLRSFVGKQFFRYLITGLIEAMVALAVLRAFVNYLDRRGVLKDWKYRNTLAAVVVAVFLFLLFVNVLRFDWAYKDTDDAMMNIIVLMWTTIVVMMYALFKITNTSSIKGVDGVRVDSQRFIVNVD
jgi:hypothetical protein